MCRLHGIGAPASCHGEHAGKPGTIPAAVIPLGAAAAPSVIQRGAQRSGSQRLRGPSATQGTHPWYVQGLSFIGFNRCCSTHRMEHNSASVLRLSGLYHERFLLVTSQQLLQDCKTILIVCWHAIQGAHLHRWGLSLHLNALWMPLMWQSCLSWRALPRRSWRLRPPACHSSRSCPAGVTIQFGGLPDAPR